MELDNFTCQLCALRLWRCSASWVTGVMAAILAATAFFPSDPIAAAEWVYVARTMSSSDEAMIVRRSGEAYLIEKGVGCLSLWRQEGSTVLVDSPGLFLGVGSKLILPDEGQECRVWNAEPLDAWQGGPVPGLRPQVDPPPQSPIAALQAVLNALGYSAGAQDGVLGPKTKSAVAAFQRDEGLPETGEPDEQTISTLIARLKAAGLNLSNPGQPPDRSPPTVCDSGHWVSEVLGGGEIVKLEDGSLWEIDIIDRIDTALWLPVEEILVCGGTQLINADTGDTVGAVRIR